MSIISEQVKELREYAKYWEYNAPKKPIDKIFIGAADTIESLSAKLKTEKRNQSAERYAREEVIKKLKEKSNGKLPETRPYVYLNTVADIIRGCGDIWFPGYYRDNWILCRDRMPEEYSYPPFEGEKGNYLLKSKDVLTTVIWENGTRETVVQQTINGKWETESKFGCNVIAWQPFMEPYHKS